MFRVWGKIIKKNHLIKDMVVEIENYDISRTQKVYQALETMCYEFDLAKPIWLEINKNDFTKFSINTPTVYIFACSFFLHT